MPAFLADRRLWVTADRSRVVEEGDPSAAYLLAAIGFEIEAPAVARYGLTLDGSRVVLADESKSEAKEAEPPEDKELAEPENKAAAEPARRPSRKRK